MISKGFLRFKNRMDSFLLDCELTDIIVVNKEKIAGKCETIFLNTSIDNHTLLCGRSNTKNSRTIVVKHLRKTIMSAFIKDMYEEVIEYMTYLLKEAAQNGVDSNRIIGDIKVEFKGNELLQQRNIDNVIQLVIRQVIRSLDSLKRSLNIIKEINKKLGLNIPIKDIDKVMPYLQLRHILVHSDGRPEEKERVNYGLDKKGKVILSLEYIKQIYKEMIDLLSMFDNIMLERNYISKREISSKGLS